MALAAAVGVAGAFGPPEVRPAASPAACASPAEGGIAGAAGARQQPRLEGEHGLWVRLEEGRIHVRWLTGATAAGRLEAVVGERVVHRDSTEPAGGHQVSFRPPSSDSVVLRYGRAGCTNLHRTTVWLEEPKRMDVTFPAPDSLYVIGDVHGQFDRLLRLLGNAGLVDGEGRWSGGRARLALLGDMFDRGADVTRTLWYLYGLEREAERVGGRVIVVMGNHEVMALTGDHRYLAPKESLLATLHGVPYYRMYDPRTSVLGRWIATRPAAVRVGRVLMAHGGVGPAYADWSLRAIDDSLRAFVGEPLFRFWADTTLEVPPMDSAAVARRVAFLFEEESVFWYRGYARSDTLDSALRRALRKHRSRVHVVAHTPVPTIRERYGGKLILVDLEQPASELLFLEHRKGEWKRRVIGLEGPPRPLRPSPEGDPGG